MPSSNFLVTLACSRSHVSLGRIRSFKSNVRTVNKSSAVNVHLITTLMWSEMLIVILLSRVDYLEKSKHLQDQLRDLRSEIEVLKVGEKQSEFDLIHDEQVRTGENKYSTLKRVNQNVFTYLWSTRASAIEVFNSCACFVYKTMQWRLVFVYPVGAALSSKLEANVYELLFLCSVFRKWTKFVFTRVFS